LVVSIPGDFVLYDIAADGRVLLGRLVETTEILGTFPEEPRERNLSQFDLSIATDLSPDGNVLLFSDAFRPGEELAGSPTGIYIRKTERTVPKRLGEVWQSSPVLSPDGNLVLAKGVLSRDVGKAAATPPLPPLFPIPPPPPQ